MVASLFPSRTVPELLPWYPQIKMAHISLVVASGMLFAWRGAMVLAGRAWVMGRHWRVFSYVIDTGLLAAGATLWTTLSLNPLMQHRLAAKLWFLLVYVVLGSMALKRARTPVVRQTCFVAALAVYGFMASVAYMHDPLGLLLPWVSHGA